MNAVRRREDGQSLPLVLAAAGAVVALALAAGALGGILLARSGAQSAADLAAVSAARRLWDLLPRMAADDPAGRRDWSGVLADAARPAAEGGGARLLEVRLPGPRSWPPTAVEVRVARPAPLGLRVTAVARAGLSAATGLAGERGPLGWATGGGYSGPLVYRDGKPTCPAVAAAFDAMDAAAHSAGIDLAVVSGFRSDAEQAVLFARHPDPKWVAPPGRSRHRDATELDLSLPSGAHEWLAAHAGAFGFLQRYSWEPWHWGYLPGCGGGAGTPVPPGAAVLLPSWVPAAYRGLVLTSALRAGVPPALLAALLRAESDFDPRAVSSAGALGIAQFMPGTAAGMGLRDPFDPAQAIPAAARLLAANLREFGSPALALAAYNAGGGAVRRHGGVPPYRETQAYVARVLALAGQAGSIGPGAGGGVVLLRAGEGLV